MASAYKGFSSSDDEDEHPRTTAATLPIVDPAYLSNGKKSLSGVSLRAFLLGSVLGVSVSLTVLLVSIAAPLWRLPFFMTALCLFHFLEYHVTARYNTANACVSSFLLTTNGWAYNLANIASFVECFLRYAFFSYPASSSAGGISITVTVGFMLTVMGQTFRTLAMAQAGANFNHTVQVKRKKDHVLVTWGVYSVLRHPSYFGYFWWVLGMQLVMGNVVCSITHSIVLWSFFRHRIRGESHSFFSSYPGVLLTDVFTHQRKRPFLLPSSVMTMSTTESSLT